MIPRVDILIPYRPSTPCREHAYTVVRSFYEQLLPSWNVIVADDPAGGDLFATGRAFNAAFEQSTADVVVYQDADSLVPYGQVILAVRKALHTTALVKAFDVYHRLSQGFTEADGLEWIDVVNPPGEEIVWTQSPVMAMGVTAVQWRSFASIGAFDPRFEGWGYDDIALETLAGATIGIERIPGPLYHLWHERRLDEQDGSPSLEENRRLNDRYEGNAGSGDALLGLRMEAEWIRPR